MPYVWHIFGCLIGYAASRRRGYEAVHGIVAGGIFGPILGIALFLVDGIVLAGPQRNCRHCERTINAASTVCRKCGRTLIAGAEL